MIYLTAIYRFLGIRGCIAVGLALALGVALWRNDSLSAELQRKRDQIAAMEVASEAARAAQQAANDAAAARYQELAERSEHDHKTTSIVVHDATDNFIRDNGVQNGQCVPGNTDSAPQGDGAAVPVAMPAQTIVDTADVRACGDLYAYALSAHEWAKGLAAN